jgi:hypothetical protein
MLGSAAIDERQTVAGRQNYDVGARPVDADQIRSQRVYAELGRLIGSPRRTGAKRRGEKSAETGGHADQHLTSPRRAWAHAIHAELDADEPDSSYRLAAQWNVRQVMLRLSAGSTSIAKCPSVQRGARSLTERTLALPH